MGGVEIFRGQVRRRWSEEDKRRLVAETLALGETVHGVARRRGVSASQLFAWRKRYQPGLGRAVRAARVPGFVALEIAPVASPTPVDDGRAMTGASPPTGLIEVELPDGGRVRISGDPDPAVVAAALRAVVRA